MVFEYEKGTKGVDADQFEEIVESLMSRADAYEQWVLLHVYMAYCAEAQTHTHTHLLHVLNKKII